MTDGRAVHAAVIEFGAQDEAEKEKILKEMTDGEYAGYYGLFIGAWQE